MLNTVTKDNGSNKASVFLRIRSEIGAPYEIENNIFKIRYLKPENRSKNFIFTNIFRHESSQSEVYGKCVQPAIQSQENLTVLTYGTSNSGKTFTLMGDEKQPGIIPRAIEQTFSRYKKNICSTPTLKMVKGEWSILDDDAVEVESKNREMYFGKSKCSALSSAQKNVLRESSDDDGTIAYVWISFVEIHNENVFDLLELTSKKMNKNRRNLTVVSNGGNAYISGLTSVLVTNAGEASLLLNMGVRARQNGSTSINPQSSRSHCIFIVDIIRQDQAEGMVTNTSYKFCDLAGSERLKKSEAKGARCEEAKNINKSLLVLGRCLNSIYNNQRMRTFKEIVPLRDSKLTFFLQSSLAGRDKLSFIVNMFPTAEFHDENEQVLKYASMAHEIVYQKPAKEVVCGRRSTFTKFLAQANGDPSCSNIPESVKYPQVLLILNENDR